MDSAMAAEAELAAAGAELAHLQEQVLAKQEGVREVDNRIKAGAAVRRNLQMQVKAKAKELERVQAQADPRSQRPKLERLQQQVGGWVGGLGGWVARGGVGG